jgi:hypothetical protein
MSIRHPPTFDPESADTLAVIETPKRNRNKFAYNQALDVFELKKVLPRNDFSLRFRFHPVDER